MSIGSISPEWLHPPSLAAATEIQRHLALRVVAEDALEPVEWLGGADISHNPRDPAALVHAAIVTLGTATLTVAAKVHASSPASFPYVPGFLGFRETPCLIEAYGRLSMRPDLIFVDGHGLSHPRGLGIASHLGVLLDRPTIGVAKSILVGKPADILGPEPGDSVPLVWRGRTIGMVLRTKRRVNPVYVSVGHRISLGSAVKWVMASTRGYRLPEPTRQAHLAANAFRTAAP